jgi:hypothetical protein
MAIELANRRQGANIQTKVEELEELNQSFRNRDKMKDDAIAQLSGQLMASLSQTVTILYGHDEHRKTTRT